MIEFANSALISSLLPAIDDLDRAMASVPAGLEKSSWTEGVRLIYNKFKTILQSQGLTEIEARGEPFDPRLHEAVMQQEGEEGMVVDETQRGYRFRDRVIRPSLVIVGTVSGSDETDQTTQEEE
jgi:molecular chaperone GrpE